MTADPQSPPTSHPPEHWSSDVVLADGTTAHIRPISRADGRALQAFHLALSDQSRYMRFFTAKPRLPDAMVEHFTTVDYHNQLTLVAEMGGRLAAVASYEREGDTDQAEVAFVVADEYQGRGLGTVLLEHLAADARERGITRFTAETLATNRQMLRVFRTAGFAEHTHLDHGVVGVELLIEPSPAAQAAMEQREHRAEAASIARLLVPRSVAVVGAGRSPQNVGHQVLRNLLGGNFDGPVYPVNPGSPHVASVPAYPNVTAIPGPVDLAVIAVPAPAVAAVLEECGARGVKGVVVLSAGFGEVGEGDGEAELRRLARLHSMRLVGPNCIGMVNTAIGLDATFSPYRPSAGRVAMLSQSGAIGIALLERSQRLGLGVSAFVSVGNKADVSSNDLLQYWEDDPGTDVVLLYLESFGNPRKFARIARRVSRRKPIVAVKSGRTPVGVRAASSHTAAMASPDTAVDALFRQTGVIRVDTLEEQFDMALVLGCQPLPAGNRVAIVGNSGGPGILATDACVAAGLEVPTLGEATQQALRAILDPKAATANPVDLVAGATPGHYRQATEVLLADPDVDAVLVICTPTFAAPPRQVAATVAGVVASAGSAGPPAASDAGTVPAATATLDAATAGPEPTPTAKPVLVSFLAWPDMPALLRPGQADPSLGGTGPRAKVQVPAFSSPEAAVRALGRAAAYAQWRRRPPGRVRELDRFDVDRAADVIAAALAAAPAGGWLTPDQVWDVLEAVGVKTARTVAVGSADAAADTAARIGFPVALKASGPDLIHKSDVGGVVLDLGDETAVWAAYTEMAARIGDRMTGGVVQAMAAAGTETIVGVVQDPVFGPLVMFGLGGVATELLGDRSFRVLPLTDADAADLVRSLRASPLLFGYRGAPPADTAALEDLLERVARLAGHHDDRGVEVAELDLNPVIVGPRGAVVVDARIRIGPEPAGPPLDVRRMTDRARPGA
ncbi:MAG: GNAT family N-acetyltransferase [Acidimicrobiia bacterium]|nr:GNAT family N-acetyltransferase [Acidimicrobiia bacterium]